MTDKKKITDQPLTHRSGERDKGGEKQTLKVEFSVVNRDLGKGVHVAGVQIETKGLEIHVTPLGIELLLMSLSMDNEDIKKAMIKAVGKMVMGDVYGYATDKLPENIKDIDLTKIKAMKPDIN